MTLEIQHLNPKDYRSMPWKNGGGATTELSIFPRDANVQSGFDWRISLADLDGSGKFSSFPGFDRVITQISGEAMVLKHNGHPDQVLSRFQPYAFSGDWQTENILHGKAQDFNVMVRRGLPVRMDSLQFRDEAIRKVHQRGTSFLWVVYGGLMVHESSKGHDHRLDVHHGLELTGEMEAVLLLKPREPDTVVFFIQIGPW